MGEHSARDMAVAVEILRHFCDSLLASGASHIPAKPPWATEAQSPRLTLEGR